MGKKSSKTVDARFIFKITYRSLFRYMMMMMMYSRVDIVYIYLGPLLEGKDHLGFEGGGV